MRFETTMSQTGNNTGIEVPSDVIEALGAGRKPPVVVTVNGYEYRSTVAVMGGRYMISFSSDKRAATGIQGGDPIVVDLEVDTAPRTVEVPADLADALDAAGARAAFDALSPSARKAHVTNVESAKAPETRQRRLESIVAKLA
ncbi:YdeI/OmpD-associated family protein [Agromyces sp. CF514]|uniref:YdeI/OmpD-associated family protein n=1 Tax=Agromyces sp. CF514 TaxID=1881031 RepID=UPI000B807282|nr:YdeI/OmpD-associated family protein [Agromyces sp. CF514]